MIEQPGGWTIAAFCFFLASYVIAIVAIAKAKTPLSRPAYVGRFFGLIGVEILAALTLFSGSGFIFLTTLGVANIFQLHWNARRYIDLDWSKWWFLTIITGIGLTIVTFLPFFFASRRSVGLEPGIVVKTVVVQQPATG